MLLLVATVVFLALRWSAIGPWGQASVIGAATAAAAAGSVRCRQAHLAASAEALGALAAGLWVVGAAGARALGLAGADAVRLNSYLLVVLGLLAVAAAVMTRVEARVVVFQIAAPLAAAGAVLAAASRTDDDLGVGLVLLAGAAAQALASRVLRHARPVAGSAAGVLAVLGLAAAVPVLLHLTWTADVGRAGTAGVALLVVSASALRRRTRGGYGDRQTVLAAGGAALAALVVAGWAHNASSAAVVLSAALAAVLGVAVAWRHAPDPQAPARLVVVGSGTLGIACVGSGAAMGADPLAATLAMLAVTCLAYAVRLPATRTVSSGLAAAAAFCAGAAGTHSVAPLGRVLAGAVAMAGIVAVAAWRRTRAEEAPLLGVASLAAAGVLGYAMSVDRPAWAEHFGVTTTGRFVEVTIALAAPGLAALAYACLPSRGRAACVGVALTAAAVWHVQATHGVHLLEAYTAPLAALTLLVGVVHARRVPSAPSWVTDGPTLTAALLPSAWASVGDEQLTRPLIVLVAATSVAIGGLLWRRQAPLVTGCLAAGVVAASQLAPWAVGLPRWLSLGAAGAVLLGVGITYEQRRRDAAAATGWLRALR